MACPCGLTAAPCGLRCVWHATDSASDSASDFLCHLTSPVPLQAAAHSDTPCGTCVSCGNRFRTVPPDLASAASPHCIHSALRSLLRSIILQTLLPSADPAAVHLLPSSPEACGRPVPVLRCRCSPCRRRRHIALLAPAPVAPPPRGMVRPCGPQERTMWLALRAGHDCLILCCLPTRARRRLTSPVPCLTS